MKKIYTLIAALAFVAGSFAQTDNTFEFVDKDGNVVPDGSTITVNEVYEDEWGVSQIKTGLYVISHSSNKEAVGLTFNLSKMDNGNLSVCFPSNCINYDAVGTYDNKTAIVDPNMNKDFQTEWLPATYGTATATFTLSRYEVVTKTVMGVQMEEVGEKIADGPTVTVNFVYADPTAINGVESSAKKAVVARYNANGQRIAEPQHGLNIVKYSDGTTRKVVVKD